jgi:hypothetical protein
LSEWRHLCAGFGEFSVSEWPRLMKLAIHAHCWDSFVDPISIFFFNAKRNKCYLYHAILRCSAGRVKWNRLGVFADSP